MKRIAVWTHLEIYGGGTRALTQWLASIDSQRYRVTMFCSRKLWENQAFRAVEANGVEAVFIDAYLEKYKRYALHCRGVMYYLLAVWIRQALRGCLSKRQFDAVYLDCIRHAPTLLAMKMLGLKKIFAGLHLFPSAQPRPVSRLERMAARRTEKIIVPCKAAQEAWKDVYACAQDNFMVCYNGVTPVSEEELLPAGVQTADPGRKTILMVSAFEGFKQHRLLLDVYRDLLSRGLIDADLVMPGTGPEHPVIAGLVEAYGLSERVQLPGLIEQMDSLYQAADLVVHPSAYDNFPFSILEAMNHAKPVIASSVGGIPEMVDHQVSGWLVDPGDADALSTAIVSLLDDDALRFRMGQAGREKVLANFTQQRMVKSFEQVFA